MDVLITGGSGTVGTAITDHLADRDDYRFTFLDLKEHPDPAVKSVIADAAEYDQLASELKDTDAVIHLANIPLDKGGPWERTVGWSRTHADNLRLHATIAEAAVDAGVESLVWASSNHAVGMHEVTNAPDIYYPESDVLEESALPRPDSMYGIEKVYGEGLGRLAAEAHGVRFYALRIGAVRDPEYDHPYGDAEAGVDRGEWTRGSDPYEEQVARLKALWLSRRDCAQLIDCCLQDESVSFDVFHGVSANDRRWLDIEHARDVLGYQPRDNGDEWESPPAEM